MKAQSRHPANVEAGKPLKFAAQKTCKNSGSQGLEIPACQNEPSGAPKSELKYGFGISMKLRVTVTGGLPPTRPAVAVSGGLRTGLSSQLVTRNFFAFHTTLASVGTCGLF